MAISSLAPISLRNACRGVFGANEEQPEDKGYDVLDERGRPSTKKVAGSPASNEEVVEVPPEALRTDAHFCGGLLGGVSCCLLSGSRIL